MKKNIERIIHLIQRFSIVLREYPQNVRAFGFPVANVMAWNYLIPTGRSPRFIRTIYRHVEKELAPVWKKYQSLEQSDEKEIGGKVPVWICWFQGEAAMPELVKVCYESVKRNLPDNAEIKLVTLENISKYVEIPEVIFWKFQQGIISYALFSDVLRYHLLKEHGGMWIDATIYVSSPIPSQWLTWPYYTMRMQRENCPKEPCEGNWTNFCFSGKKNNLIFCFVCDGLDNYLTNKNRIPDYIILDYILMVGYRNIPAMKRMIDHVPYNNEKIWNMKNALEKPFDEEQYRTITKDNVFHKLSHQAEYRKQTEQGSETVYGHITRSGY